MIPAIPVAIMLTVASGAAPEQGRDLRCGSYCLYVALKALDLPVTDHQQLEDRLGQPTPQGYSMEALAEAARSFGAHAEGVHTSLDGLARRRGPFACIARLDKPGHFLLIRDINSDVVDLIDPPNRRTVPRDTFQALWSGEALLISSHPLTMRMAWGTYASSAGAALAILALAGWWLRGSRRKRGLTVLILAIIAGGCADGEVPVPRQPRASVSPPVVELGKVLASSDKSFRAALTLENRGTSPLHILNHTTSCGCTMMALDDPKLMPGERRSIPLAIAPGLAGGPRESRVILTTDDPVTPVIEIPIRWTNLVPIIVEPPMVDFGAIRPGADATADVLVRLEADSGGGLTVRCTDSRVTWRWTGESTPSATRAAKWLRLALEKAAEGGPGAGVVSIVTEAGHSVDVPVQWREAAPLSASPAALFVSGADARSETKRSIIVSSGDSADFRISGVTVDGRPAPIPDATAAGRHILPVTLPSPTSPGVHTIEVVISTDLDGAAPLVVPCTLVTP